MFNWKASKKEPDQEEEKISLPDQNPETEEDLQPAQELKEAGIAVQEKPEAAAPKEKVYHVSFPGIILRSFVRAFISGIALFLLVVALSLAAFIIRQVKITDEAYISIRDGLEASNSIRNAIVDNYDLNLRFMEYEYNRLRENYPDAPDKQIYDELADSFMMAKCAIVNSSGRILASSPEFDPLKYYGKIDRLKISETRVKEKGDSSTGLDEYSIIYRRIGDDVYGLFQYDADTSADILTTVYSTAVLVKNKSTPEESIFITDMDDTIIYAPKEEMIGQKLSYFGERVNFIDGTLDFTFMIDTGTDSKVILAQDAKNNTGYFIIQQTVSLNGMKICCATDLAPTYRSMRTYSLVLAVFLFFLMILQGAYVFYNRQYRDAGVKSASYSANAVGYKTVIVGILGAICAAGFTYYTNTMYSLSNFIVNTDGIISMLGDFKAFRESINTSIEDIYSNQYVLSANAISNFLSEFPQFQNKRTLKDIADIYGIRYIVLYDMDGLETVASNTFTNLDIKESEIEDFPKLVNGRLLVIGPLVKDELLGTSIKPIGVLLKEKTEGNPIGIQEAGFDAKGMEGMLGFMTMDRIINQMIAAGNTSIFIIDSETKELVYSPNRDTIGESCLNFGFREEQLKENYTGTVVFDGQPFYVTSRSFENSIVYGGVPYITVFVGRFPITAAASLLALLNFLAILRYMRPKRIGYDRVVYAGKRESIVIPPELRYEYYNPDLRTGMFELSDKKKYTFSLRYLFRRWKKKVPEQKVLSLLRLILLLVGCYLIYSYYAGSGITSVINYSMDSSRGIGFNVYALTSILVIIAVGFISVSIVVAILDLLTQLVQPRGETICRLLKSTIELFSALVIIYFCLARLGFDIKMLVASAGLMGLVISMGARDLIVDILAGLFIIFEGDFEVGDIISVGNFTGTVREIGIRTTKIVSWDKNIKIENNRNLSSVINLSDKNSFAVIDFSVPGSVDIGAMEEILNTGLAEAKKKYPQLLGTPYFKGVQKISGSRLECRIVAEVAERYRVMTVEQLNEEVNAILKENGIPLS